MVAERAQVSRVAVSRAFNPNASIKPEKRREILRIAGELNYTPDMAARSMVTGRSHLVGVIVPDVCSPWESQEIDALTSALQNAGFATLLFKTRTDYRMDETLLTYMRGFNPDSVITFTENVRPRTLARVLDRAVPIYVCYDDDDTTDATDQPTDGPLFDRLNVIQKTGIEQGIALIQGQGARRIAFISGAAQSIASTERLRTVRAVMARRGLGAPLLIPGDFTYDTARRAVIDQFRIQGPVDAIIAANDVSAFGALDALRHDLGFAVPGDVRVVGFDDISQAHWKAYDLTTVRIDLAERVAALVRLILRRLAAPDAPSLSETVGTQLVVRSTV
ncbi:MAG: LacI family DNA-binding transcriptional regulator [Rubellimicrobium sp.]|nr:LacI family DNA-binding transcriptional regulator [Rubellimicrobium sp.]